MDAPQQLEKAATGYALEAIRLDKQNSKGMAITMYQRAVETLLNLVQLYPEYSLNKVYIQRAIAYQDRIKILQGQVGHDGSQPGSSRKVEGTTASNNGGEASYDELILKEKPNVN